jgi:dienelactone hydrolase
MIIMEISRGGEKMGNLIFLTVVVVEIAFAVFCISTKSNQQKVRNIIRIEAFVLFLLCIILPIIEWSFRYYTLAALLFLMAVMGTVALIRKKEEIREYKTARVVLKSIGMMVLIVTLTLPAIIFPQHKAMGVTGEYRVKTLAQTYTDTKRVETYTDTDENRKLNVKIWYPENAEGTYPLMVFSHGAFGIKSSNESLYNELASHGYVVCSIDHTYQCLFTKGEDGHTTRIDMGYMEECSADNARVDRQKSYEYYQKWMGIRTGDINFVIDHILAEAKNNNAETVYKLVDTAKIGVMGHSLGGSAALGIGRMRDDVSAVIALESPFMCDIKGVKDGEFVFEDEIYPVPVLNVYSNSSWKFLSEWPQYAENYAMLSGTNTTAFNVYMSGVGHLSLTDFALTSPFFTRIFDGQKSTTSAEDCLNTISKICLEFFDCYLKGEGKFTSVGNY